MEHAAYPLVVLDAVRAAQAKRWGEVVSALGALEPDIALTQMAMMFAELVSRYDRDTHHDPGWLMERLCSQYEATRVLASGGTIAIHPAMTRPNRNQWPPPAA